MPENKPNLRYSEVISEVMEAIIKDQMNDTNFETEILERISSLPVYQRSIGTAMGMLSDRLKISLALTDANGNILNSVFWPRMLELDIQKTIENFDKKEKNNKPDDHIYIRYSNINSVRGHKLDLFILKQDNSVSDENMKQIVNVMRICLNLWSQKHGEQVLPELVQAIMRDEPFRMRRIAAIFKIDVASIHNMWIITPLQNETNNQKIDNSTQTLLTLIRKELSPYCKTIVADIYNQDVVAFMDNPIDLEMMPLADSLYQAMKKSKINGIVSVFLNLKDTAEVRQSYLQNKNALATARIIYPNKKIFNHQEINFAEKCQNIISRGEEYANQAMSVLSSFDHNDSRQSNEQIETIAAFLLDAENSLDKCADIIFLHRNSVKYRINQINERLGFKLGHMPETIGIYTAVAVRRILKTRVNPEPANEIHREPLLHSAKK
jgi:DNA-binding PucR family transcriptional regulator